MDETSFPGHEKAIEIMDNARKDLEALGYKAGFSKTLTSHEDESKNGWTVFEMKFTAAKEC